VMVYAKFRQSAHRLQGFMGWQRYFFVTEFELNDL
jgi:hypothetical protein